CSSDLREKPQCEPLSNLVCAATLAGIARSGCNELLSCKNYTKRSKCDEHRPMNDVPRQSHGAAAGGCSRKTKAFFTDSSRSPAASMHCRRVSRPAFRIARYVAR